MSSPKTDSDVVLVPTARGWAMLAGLLTLVVAGGIAFVATGGLTKMNDIFDQDQYQDRLDAISAVYRQGARTRESLARSGVALPDEATCTDAFHRTGADRERDFVDSARKIDGVKTDVGFAELRRLSFVNGCLGRPNHLPATPLPPTPTPTSSTGAPNPD